MQTIRQIIDDAPEHVDIPPDLRHRRIPVIFWPLDDAEVRSRRPNYLRAKVDTIKIPSREERNAKRRVHRHR